MVHSAGEKWVNLISSQSELDEDSSSAVFEIFYGAQLWCVSEPFTETILLPFLPIYTVQSVLCVQ